MYYLKEVFTSRSALEGYIKCVRNIKIGDRVFIYGHRGSSIATNQRFYAVNRITDHLFECEAIGFLDGEPYKVDDLYYPRIILGSNQICLGSKGTWVKYIQDAIDKSGKQYDQYSPITYLLVGKIIKRI